jgi:hypothetical protein
MKAFWCLQRALGEDQGIPHWNDAPGRSKEDVLDLYDRAIAMSLNL